MTFRLTDFSSVEIEQIVDDRTPNARYKRSRVEGNEGPYWIIELTTKPLKYREAMAASAYLDSLKGSLEIIQFPCPFPQLVARTNLTNSVVDSKNSTTSNIGGFASNQANAVLAGDFIQYTNHPKVYRLVDDANANTAGRISVKTTPEKLIDTTLNETIKHGDDVFFQCCLGGSVSMEVIAGSKFTVFNITLVEQG